MTRQKEILNRMLMGCSLVYDLKVPDKFIPYILNAMQEYAEEYHQSELLKLNKSDVISSVCSCDNFHGELETKTNYCWYCLKLIKEQTDL